MADKRSHPPIPVIVILVLAVIGGGVWWWWAATHPSTAADSALSGTVEAKQYQVAAATAGRVTTVLVAEGDQVAKGEELVRLDDAALKLQVEQAEQGVVAAKAALTNAKNDDDSTKADITAAEAKVTQAKAAVKLAEVQLSYAVITAPQSGTVVSVTTNVGQNAGPGKTLLTLTDTADLFVRVFVPETEIGNVKVGQTAAVTSDSGSSSYPGTVSYIASNSEFTPNTVQTKDQRVKLVYEVRLTVSDDSGTLKAGMPVDVSLN